MKQRHFVMHNNAEQKKVIVILISWIKNESSFLNHMLNRMHGRVGVELTSTSCQKYLIIPMTSESYSLASEYTILNFPT